MTAAQRRTTSLIVLSASGGDSLLDPRHAATDTMAGVEEELGAAGIPHTVEHRSGRDPVDEIVALAGQDDVDLVIGLRRRSPVGKLLMGSSAQRILLGVNCPVLAVRGAGEPPA